MVRNHQLGEYCQVLSCTDPELKKNMSGIRCKNLERFGQRLKIEHREEEDSREKNRFIQFYI